MFAFPYFGGKASLSQLIIGLLPTHTHYIEPFGGSAAILLNKKPSEIETYNDLDSDVVTFFRVLRSEPEKLTEQIRLTPYSRDEYEISRSGEKNISDLERARRFYVKIRQSFNACSRASTGWRRETKASRGTPVSRSWQAAVPDMKEIAERLVQVQIENMDAIKLIKDCDSESALFYIDPPYVLKTRKYKKAYRYELDNQEHEDLGEVLKNLKGQVILSGYNCELYESLYSSWTRIDIPILIRSSKAKRVESLWLNFDPPSQQTKIDWSAI